MSICGNKTPDCQPLPHLRKVAFLLGTLKSKSTQKRGYDIIGDIHGNAATCETLLRKLGYHEEQGVFRHPENTAVFVGDIINRGPRIAETLRLVRAMCEAGTALMVLGNHEMDALRIWSANGRDLRPNVTEKQLRRGEATRRQVAEPRPDDWADYLAWFRTLPLYLDFSHFRVVHACWDPVAIESLGGLCSLPLSAIDDIGPAKGPRTQATEALIQGPEFPVEIKGRPIEKARAKWWRDPESITLKEAVLPKSSQMPDYPPLPLTEIQRRAFRPYADTECPVFFGHYSWEGHPLPYQKNLACLDLSIARGGSLCAYRWRGEENLLARNFLQIPAIG